MQSYNKDLNEKEFSKKILSEFFGFLKYKVDNDLLTLDELRSFFRIMESNMPLTGTSDDFAAYFHQTPGNVRNVINRRMFSKPKRRVMYSFLEFCRIIPDKLR